MDLVAVVQDASDVRRSLADAGIALRDTSPDRRRRTAPTRAWDPMPFDGASVQHAGRDPCRDVLPPDDWTA